MQLLAKFSWSLSTYILSCFLLWYRNCGHSESSVQNWFLNQVVISSMVLQFVVPLVSWGTFVARQANSWHSKTFKLKSLLLYSTVKANRGLIRGAKYLVPSKRENLALLSLYTIWGKCVWMIEFTIYEHWKINTLSS